MSDQLQSPTLDLAAAGDLAQSVISEISAKCTEVAWNNITERAKQLSLKAGIITQQPITAAEPGSSPDPPPPAPPAPAPPPPPPREKRKTQPPRHLADFIVEAPIDTRSDNRNDTSPVNWSVNER